MTPLQSLHHIWRNLKFVAYHAIHAQGLQLALTLLGVAFALVFFVIGLSRIVEFQDLGFGKIKVWIFSVLHIIGVCLFTFAMILFGADAGRSMLEFTGWILLPGLAILLPLHIYTNIIRRVRHGDLLAEVRRSSKT